MLGGFASGLGTPFSTAEKHKQILLYGLESDYYDRYLNAVRTTTAAQIMHAAVTYLRPESYGNYRSWWH